MLRKILVIFFITSLSFVAHARFLQMRGKNCFLQAISKEPLVVACFYQYDRCCKDQKSKCEYEHLKSMMSIASKNHKFHYAQVAFMMVQVDQSFCDIISLSQLPSLMIFVDGQPYKQFGQDAQESPVRRSLPSQTAWINEGWKGSIEITQFVDQAIGTIVDKVAQQKLCYQEQLRLQAIAAWGFYGPWYYRPYWYGGCCWANRGCW